MLEGYYAEKDRAERLRTKSKELHKAVHNMYERAVRKQAAWPERWPSAEWSANSLRRASRFLEEQIVTPTRRQPLSVRRQRFRV